MGLLRFMIIARTLFSVALFMFVDRFHCHAIKK